MSDGNPNARSDGNPTDLMPRLMIRVGGGVIEAFMANMPVEVTVHDRDLEEAGEPLGVIVQTFHPDDVRSPEEYERARLDLVTGLIEGGR